MGINEIGNIFAAYDREVYVDARTVYRLCKYAKS